MQGTILHNDRRCRYTSENFRNKLKANGMNQSLSSVDHCNDNARRDSFFATPKKELLYWIPTYRMKKAKVETIIFRYVFTYYNKIRIHTSNPDGFPPVSYRNSQQVEAKAA